MLSRDFDRLKREFPDLNTWFTYAVVVRGPIEEIERLKNFIAEKTQLVLVYHTLGDRLWITRKPPREENRKDKEGEGLERESS